MAKGLSMTMAQQHKAAQLQMEQTKLQSQDFAKGVEMAMNQTAKAADLELREKESQLRNTTKVNVTKLKDKTKLDERE
jgi:hypothetical protein